MCHELGCQVGRNWAAMWAGLKKGLQLQKEGATLGEGDPREQNQ